MDHVDQSVWLITDAQKSFHDPTMTTQASMKLATLLTVGDMMKQNLS